jgi:hypothetical protein
MAQDGREKEKRRKGEEERKPLLFLLFSFSPLLLFSHGFPPASEGS